MSVNPRPRLRRALQGGFSLIEVLVALLVLAIGLLGLAALQTQGVRYNHDAFVRTNATSLAAEMVDAMRASGDPTQFVTANFPARNIAPPGGYSSLNPPYNCNPANGGADPATMAANALPCWLNGVELVLPAGQATVAQQAVPNEELFDITLMWLDREPREFGNDTRLPQNQAECEALVNRQWQAATNQCFVTQTWTVWP